MLPHSEVSIQKAAEMISVVSVIPPGKALSMVSCIILSITTTISVLLLSLSDMWM